MLALSHTNWFVDDEDPRVLTIPSCMEQFAAPLFISPPMIDIAIGHKLIAARRGFFRVQEVVEGGVQQLESFITEFARMRMHSSRAVLCATVPRLRCRGSVLPFEMCKLVAQFAAPQLPVYTGVAITVLNVMDMPLPTSTTCGFQFEDWCDWVDPHRADIIQHTRLLPIRRWRLRLMRLRLQAFVTAAGFLN